jgi:hypothetical protein
MIGNRGRRDEIKGFGGGQDEQHETLREAAAILPDAPLAEPAVFCQNRPMLDQRSRTLLKALVEHYIADGQPVGSRSLSRFSGLDLSPATIRNVMADLEEAGFVASPHTSAGRIPTPRGYRLFVDSLLTVEPLDRARVDEIEGALQVAQPQQLIASASHLLSSLTHFAGIVVAPRRNAPRIRQMEFLALSEKRILLILVTTDGDVQNRILASEKSYSSAELVAAANYLNQHFGGLDFEQIGQRLSAEIEQLRDILQHYIQEAIAIEQTGTTIHYKKISEFPIPTELQQHFDEDFSFKMAFENLSAGRQRGYLLYFAAPKNSSTRHNRITKCIPQILAGKGLQD